LRYFKAFKTKSRKTADPKAGSALRVRKGKEEKNKGSVPERQSLSAQPGGTAATNRVDLLLASAQRGGRAAAERVDLLGLLASAQRDGRAANRAG
jgi:hypothetical protein